MTKAMGKRSVNWFRMRYEQRRRKNTTARWSARTRKEPGPDGSTKSLARSPGRHSGELNHCALSFSFSQFMMFSTAHPTCILHPSTHQSKWFYRNVLSPGKTRWRKRLSARRLNMQNSSQSAGIMGGEHAVSQSKLLQQTIKTFGVKGLQCRRAIKNILEA